MSPLPPVKFFSEQIAWAEHYERGVGDHISILEWGHHASTRTKLSLITDLLIWVHRVNNGAWSHRSNGFTEYWVQNITRYVHPYVIQTIDQITLDVISYLEDHQDLLAEALATSGDVEELLWWSEYPNPFRELFESALVQLRLQNPDLTVTPLSLYLHHWVASWNEEDQFYR